MTKREAALREAIKLVGVKEGGLNNRGPIVDQIQRWDTLPGVGYSWCQSFQNYAWEKANHELLADGTASVWYFNSWARKRHYQVSRPMRGDHVTFSFSGGGPFDHVGIVERVLGLGVVQWIQTIEGNTGATGSVGDPGTGRDGVYRKRRLVRSSTVNYLRVPGEHPGPKPPKPKPNAYLRWKAWYLGSRKPSLRPHDIPKRIPKGWWLRLKKELKAQRRRR